MANNNKQIAVLVAEDNVADNIANRANYIRMVVVTDDVPKVGDNRNAELETGC